MKVTIILLIIFLSFAYGNDFEKLPFDKEYSLKQNNANPSAEQEKELLELNLEGYLDYQDKEYSKKFKTILENDFNNININEDDIVHLSKQQLALKIRQEVKELKELVKLITLMETTRRAEKDRVRQAFNQSRDEAAKNNRDAQKAISYTTKFNAEKEAWMTITRKIRKSTGTKK